MYSAFVTRIKNLRKHSNADRLLCGECFGNTVIVGLDTQPDELGVYFPVDGKLGIEFAQKNDLLRRKDENGNPAGGYLDPEKRNIKALKLRGEKSDGLFMPLSSLAEFTDISQLKEGDTITQLDGVMICEKYVPARKQSTSAGAGNRTRKRKDPISPLFMEHADTEQLPYNLGAFHARELIGRYNDFASLNCMVGTAMEKQKALCHPYPATMDKIERFGYDPKQLHHILRLEEFMTRWLDGEPYEDCLLSKKTDYLKQIKFGCLSKDEAVEMADREEHEPSVNRAVDYILNQTLLQLFK